MTPRPTRESRRLQSLIVETTSGHLHSGVFKKENANGWCWFSSAGEEPGEQLVTIPKPDQVP